MMDVKIMFINTQKKVRYWLLFMTDGGLTVTMAMKGLLVMKTQTEEISGSGRSGLDYLGLPIFGNLKRCANLLMKWANFESKLQIMRSHLCC